MNNIHTYRLCRVVSKDKQIITAHTSYVCENRGSFKCSVSLFPGISVKDDTLEDILLFILHCLDFSKI